MSKTFMYLLATIAVYLVIVKGLGALENQDNDDPSDKTDTKKNDTKNSTGLNDNADENGVSQGAAGRMRHGIGYTN